MMGVGGQKERKFATALFVDIVGYTSLVEQHDPEIVAALIQRAFGPLTDEITRHGGFIEHTAGDAILALFGVPAVHEDDPERAVRSGLQLQAVMAELSRDLVGEGKPALAIRVGIEAGDVLVDLDQVHGSHDRMVTGDAVNIAARLQGAADPGDVLVGPRAHTATKDIVDYEPAGLLELRGKDEPVDAWRASRLRLRFRDERAPLTVEAQLIGRDEELGILTRSLERAESEGRPVLTTILGPPGTGKSRLVRELARHVETLPDTYYWRAGRCRAYGDVAYSALVDVVKAQCEIAEDDPFDEVEARIDRAVSDLGADQSVANAVGALVSASEHSFTREQLFDAWQGFFERMAARYPLVLVFEDIHWADDGLLDFIDYLADWARGPIMLLTAARPDLLEKRAGWGGGKRNYAAIYLDALTGLESEAMLDELTGNCLPSVVKETVFARSEGNPLFTEEIVRMFVDRNALVRTAGGAWEYRGGTTLSDVPSSIHSLIAARLDSLQSDEKSLVQQAAVIGRIFWSGAVADLSDMAVESARDTLKRLQLKELVVPRRVPSFSNQNEFSFHHVLIRDVAYESLPKSIRAHKHQVVARWLERQAGDRRDDLAATIASHYVAAVGYDRDLGEPITGELAHAAYSWARAAGDRSVRVWDTAEATRWYGVALDLVETVTVDPGEQAKLWEAFATASSHRLTPEEVDDAFKEALDRYETLRWHQDLARVETAFTNHLIDIGRDPDAALVWIDRALARLEPLGDSEDHARALSTKARQLFLAGGFTEAEPLARRALELAERFDSVIVQAQVKTTLGSMMQLTGRHQEGVALLEEALGLARASGDLATYWRTINNLAGASLDAEDFIRAEALYREGMEVARKAGDLAGEAWMSGGLVLLLIENGHFPDAHIIARRGEECARAMNSSTHLGLAYLGLAFLMLMEGNVDEAARLCQASGIAEGNPTYESWRLEIEGLIALARGEVDEGVQKLLRSIQLDDEETGEGKEMKLLDAVRGLAHADRAHEATPHRDELRSLAAPGGEAFRLALWADGLVAEDPAERVAILERVVASFEAIGSVLRRGMALIDLGRALRDSGKDPRPTFRRAREILEQAGAGLYVHEVDEELGRKKAL